MTPLSIDQAMWLARGVALGHVVRLLQLWLRAGVRLLRTMRLFRSRQEIGLAR